MLMLLFAIVLLYFWWRAYGILPERYPNAAPEDVALWRQQRIKDYRQYAAFLIIWMILAMANTVVIRYAAKHHHIGKLLYLSSSAIITAYILIVLIHIARKAYRRHQWEKNVGIL